jgi:hypothetical protein
MTALVINGDTSGSITLQVPAAAGAGTVQTLPAATGTVMVSGNMPAFSAYKTSIQSISSATTTKVTYDTVAFDTNSNFSSSRFTPTVAGYYQINATCYLTTSSGTGTNYRTQIYKNGSNHKVGGTGTTGQSEVQASVSAIVYCNGSTDYIEIYARNDGTSPGVYGDVNGFLYTYVTGCLMRTA